MCTLSCKEGGWVVCAELGPLLGRTERSGVVLTMGCAAHGGWVGSYMCVYIYIYTCRCIYIQAHPYSVWLPGHFGSRPCRDTSLKMQEVGLYNPEPPAASPIYDISSWLLAILQQLLRSAWWGGFSWGAATVLLALVIGLGGFASGGTRRPQSPAHRTRGVRQVTLPSGIVVGLPLTPQK